MTPRSTLVVLLALMAGAVLPSRGATADAPAPATAATQDALPPAVAAAADGIDPVRLRTQVRFLSDDLLEGRATGSRGGELAARYLAAQFALAGLKPAGDDGSYFQSVPFLGIETDPDNSSLGFVPAGGDAIPLKFGLDYVAGTQDPQPAVDVDTPLVFAGYGIVAPEYHWDDYAGVDVRGKVVMVLAGEPPSTGASRFGGAAPTAYGRWTGKLEEAVRHGAIGVLLIHRDDLAGYGWPVVRNSWTGETLSLADDPHPKLALTGWVQYDVARVLFNITDRKLDDLLAQAGSPGFKAFELPLHLKAHIASTVRQFRADNVLAILPGAERPAEARTVLYSAHYDHLGTDDSGHIYNGAADNATGCAILLELARAWRQIKPRPPQSVLFAALAAGEKGQLGATYLSRHLPVPAAELALDLDYDTVLPIGRPESVEVDGLQHLNFDAAARTAAQALGLGLEADPPPAAGRYFRSDAFRFLRAGIPALAVNAGTRYADHPPGWGAQQRQDFLATRYHQPTDHFDPGMDFRSNAVAAAYGLALGWTAMTATPPVAWRTGDADAGARAVEPR